MRSFTALLLPIALAGCASSFGTGGPRAVEAIRFQELPVPSRNDLSSTARPYLIGAFDKLRIDVFGVKELQKDVQADASGRLSFPLVGVVEAAGLTPDELANIIEGRLKGQFIKNPQVTVNLNETFSQLVTVDGQVQKPGLYPVFGKMTLMKAVATAGGAGEYAKLSDVVIFRNVEGRKLAGLYNLKQIRRGVYDDPEVYSNDIIIVGDSPARRIFEDFLQASPLLTTPLIILTQ